MKTKFKSIYVIFILAITFCVACAVTRNNDKILYNQKIKDGSVKICVLLENNSIDRMYRSNHGMSVFIDYYGKEILLDVGANNNFHFNANKMNVNLAETNYLFLSHNHIDHTGGLKRFIQANNDAPIFLMDSLDSKYYLRLMNFIYHPVGIRANNNIRSRVIQLDNDLSIDDKIFFIRHTVSGHRQPSVNRHLYKNVDGRKVLDTFDHEAILVLVDNEELIVLNLCSHKGILNTIETVKIKFPDKRIRSYVGGLHLHHPPTRESVSDEYLDYLADELLKMDITIYTGHCTGKYALNYLREKLGEKIQEINTGMVLYI